jgi:hypothetical protein
VKDINGKKIKVGNFVTRYCPCCGNILDCGVVIKLKGLKELVLRDYENMRDSFLEVKDLETKEVADIEIIMEKANV